MNTQVRESKSYSADGSLDVVAVWATIQGEGPHAGRPAVFVRLAGCNLQCALCDTNYTDHRSIMSAADLYRLITDTHRRRDLVVITGGEPFRQNLYPLVEMLLDGGFEVQIETNGTLFPDPPLPFSHPNLMLVCSPKTANINHRLAPFLQFYKYVLQDGYVDEEDGLPTSVLGMPIRPARPQTTIPKSHIYIQPADESDIHKNHANQQAALKVCADYGYRFCLQVHKVVGLP